MISHHAAKLLRLLKKALIKTGDTLYLSSDEGTVKTVTEVNDPNCKIVKLGALRDETSTLLNELESEELIAITKRSGVNSYITIKAKGLFLAELTLRKVVREFVRSFLFPALVALVTTLITKALSA